MSTNWLASVLALCISFLGTSSAASLQGRDDSGDNKPTQTQPQTRPTEQSSPMPYWQQIPEQGFLSFVFEREEEADGERLEGPKLAWGLWDEGDEIGGLSIYLSSVGGEHQRVSRVGIEGLGFFTWPIGPVRIFPTYGLGVEYRSHDPDSGYGGLGSLGLESAVWLGKHFQVAARLERKFEFRTDDRTELSLGMKWITTRLMPKYSP